MLKNVFILLILAVANVSCAVASDYIDVISFGEERDRLILYMDDNLQVGYRHEGDHLFGINTTENQTYMLPVPSGHLIRFSAKRLI